MNRLKVNRVIEGTTRVIGTDIERISLVIGLSLGLILPITPNKNLNDYNVQYNREYSVPVRNFISAFNERHLINTQVIEEIAKTIWTYRFRIGNFRELKNTQGVLTKVDPIADLLSGYGLSDDEIQLIAATATTQIPNIEDCLSEIFNKKVS